MLDKNQSKVVLPSWVWKDAQDAKEAKLKAIEYITPYRYPGYKIIEIRGDIALCERENV
ncbi:TPA: hypothetical protein QCW90_003331 [Bacillus mobilis]|nr:hypothetical protein [Bacillus mobilis]